MFKTRLFLYKMIRFGYFSKMLNIKSINFFRFFGFFICLFTVETAFGLKFTRPSMGAVISKNQMQIRVEPEDSQVSLVTISARFLKEIEIAEQKKLPLSLIAPDSTPPFVLFSPCCSHKRTGYHS